MNKTLIVFLGLALFWNSSRGAETLYPIADSFVRDGSFAGNNYGSDTELTIQKSGTSGNTRETYLNFSYSRGFVSNATLRVRATSLSTPTPKLWVYSASTNWNEGTVTFNTKPTTSDPLGANNIGQVAPTYAWEEFDVTSFVRQERISGRFIIGFGLVETNTGSGTVQIKSRETGNPAELVIVTNNPPTVSLTNPASGMVVGALASFTVSASASDSDGSVSRVDFYTNGVQLATDSTSPHSYSWTNVPPGSYSLTAVAVDNLGLSTTSAVISVTVDLSGLLGVWPFNEGAGTTSSSFGGPIANLSSSTNWASGYSSNGIIMRAYTNFTGSIENTNYSLLPRTGGPFTISIWLYPYSNAVPPGWSGLMMSESATNRGWDLAFYKDASGQVSINFWSLDNSGTLDLAVPITLTTNQWHKLDVTFDGATANIYLDGRVVGTGYGGIQMSTNTIYIGGLPGMTNFYGVIDDLKIYNRDLPPHEIGPVGNVQLVTVHKGAWITNALDGHVAPGKAINYSLCTTNFDATNSDFRVISGTNFIYHANDAKGPDKFQYIVSDGTFTSAPVTVVISVVAPHWLSTNGGGNGLSAGSPMTAYPSDALDEIIRTNNWYDCFYYASGTYEMSGAHASFRPTAFPGCKHIGSGPTTTLKFVNALDAIREDWMFRGGGDLTQSSADDFEISNMVLDCNAENIPKYSRGEPITISNLFSSPYLIDSVRFRWHYTNFIWGQSGGNIQFGHPKAYAIYAHVPGTGQYTNIFTETNGTGSQTNVFSAPILTDEIRVVLSELGRFGSTNVDFYGLAELELISGTTNISPNGLAGVIGAYGYEHFFAWDSAYSPSHLNDGNLTSIWASSTMGMVAAVGMIGSNLKFTGLEVVGFGTKAGHECFPLLITHFSTNNVPPIGNIFVENCVFKNPATNNNDGLTTAQIVGTVNGIVTNAHIRHCQVLNVKDFFTYSHAFSGPNLENSVVTNCEIAWYAEPANDSHDFGPALVRSNLFVNVASGVHMAKWLGVHFSTVIATHNTILLWTNSGSWACVSGGDSTYAAILTNLVFANNSVNHFPEGNWPSGGGIFLDNVRNAVSANNLIQIGNLELMVHFEPIQSGARRAFLNNTNSAGTPLRVRWMNGANPETSDQQWP